MVFSHQFSLLDVSDTGGIALLVERRVAFSAAAIVIDTCKAIGAVVSALGRRRSEDFNTALSVITPPAVTLSRVGGISHTVGFLLVARFARGSSNRTDNEKSSDKKESLELSHCCEGILLLLLLRIYVCYFL